MFWSGFWLHTGMQFVKIHLHAFLYVSDSWIQDLLLKKNKIKPVGHKKDVENQWRSRIGDKISKLLKGKIG